VYDFSDQVTMIAGASGNLGQAVAHAFHRAGARLVLLDRASDRLASLYSGLAGSPAHLLLGSVDTADVALVEQAVRAAVAQFGRSTFWSMPWRYRAMSP
jgi:NADP-dependent 3-hydroxy acid dehydrogenase YdfG